MDRCRWLSREPSWQLLKTVRLSALPPLWGQDTPSASSYYRALARMLQNGLNTATEFETLRNDVRFADLLRQLDSET